MEHNITKQEWMELGILIHDISEIIAELAVRVITIETRVLMLEDEISAIRDAGSTNG